jgi:hypothetical protein
MLVKDPATGNVIDRCAQEARSDGSAAPSLEPVANYVNFLRGLKNADGSLKEIEVGAIVSLKDGTLDPGICANPSCDAACDTPAATAACDARCSNAPTYRICMADRASLCHTFCGGEVPGRRYLELAFAFSGIAANVCSDDAGPALSKLSSVIGIPRQVQLRARPSAPELLAVRLERGGQSMECAPALDYTLSTSPDGFFVKFEGNCLLMPSDGQVVEVRRERPPRVTRSQRRRPPCLLQSDPPPGGILSRPPSCSAVDEDSGLVLFKLVLFKCTDAAPRLLAPPR